MPLTEEQRSKVLELTAKFEIELATELRELSAKLEKLAPLMSELREDSIDIYNDADYGSKEDKATDVWTDHICDVDRHLRDAQISVDKAVHKVSLAIECGELIYAGDYDSAIAKGTAEEDPDEASDGDSDGDSDDESGG